MPSFVCYVAGKEPILPSLLKKGQLRTLYRISLHAGGVWQRPRTLSICMWATFGSTLAPYQFACLEQLARPCPAAIPQVCTARRPKEQALLVEG